MKKIGRLQIIFISSVSVLVLFIIGTAIFYHGHWYNNTSVNGVNISNSTIDEAKDKIEEAFSNYSLEIVGRDGGKLKIKKNDIDFRLMLEEDLQKLYDEQHDSFFFFQVFSSKNSDCRIAFSQEKLKALIEKSELSVGSGTYKIVAPKNAYLRYSKDIGALEVVPEVYGNTIDIDNLCKKIETSITNLQTTLDLTKGGEAEESYMIPTIKSDSKELIAQQEKYNRYVNQWLQWDLGEGRLETISPDLIYRWTSFRDGKLKIRKSKIKEWVTKFCARYRTSGAATVREFTTHKNKTIKITGGDYGWIMDYEKTVTQIVKAIKSAQDDTKVQQYLADPSDANKAVLTKKLEPKYLLKAAKRDYDNPSNDWDHKNYTEISLKEQKVYVWRKGKIVFKAKCITGKPVQERATKTGVYYIKEHMPAKTLVGEDYKTKVTYWTRIMWSGTGFHTANWQNWSRWTKNYYIGRGSHGCINLSASDAKKIYELTKTFEPVFIYNE